MKSLPLILSIAILSFSLVAQSKPLKKGRSLAAHGMSIAKCSLVDEIKIQDKDLSYFEVAGADTGEGFSDISVDFYGHGRGNRILGWTSKPEHTVVSTKTSTGKVLNLRIYEGKKKILGITSRTFFADLPEIKSPEGRGFEADCTMAE